MNGPLANQNRKQNYCDVTSSHTEWVREMLFSSFIFILNIFLSSGVQINTMYYIYI